MLAVKISYDLLLAMEVISWKGQSLNLNLDLVSDLLHKHAQVQFVGNVS